MTIGERIKSKRTQLNIPQVDLAQYCGISKQTLYKYENNIITNIPSDKIELIAKKLHTTPAYLMGWEQKPDTLDLSKIANIVPMPKTKKVPILGTIACGEPILAQENIDGYADMPADADGTFALRCSGNSMINARIYDGDIVYIRQQPTVENGEIAAVLIENDVTLKRVYYYPEKSMLILKPENNSFEDFIYVGEELNSIKILGKAILFLGTVK